MMTVICGGQVRAYTCTNPALDTYTQANITHQHHQPLTTAVAIKTFMHITSKFSYWLSFLGWACCHIGPDSRPPCNCTAWCSNLMKCAQLLCGVVTSSRAGDRSPAATFSIKQLQSRGWMGTSASKRSIRRFILLLGPSPGWKRLLRSLNVKLGP